MTNDANALAPVEFLATDKDRSFDADGIGLCLSGGGYRAMLFHVGTLWRLHETSLLKQMDRISSVSGGSITSATLALAWEKIGSGGNMTGFVDKVVKPVRRLATSTIDISSVLRGIVLPGSIGEKVAEHYDEYLFDGATLQDLPDSTRFIINASNLESGALWRFSKPYMADWKVGRIEHPKVPLANAVAASSAFPPFLSPFLLKLDPKSFSSFNDNLSQEFRTDVSLSDGGVYDNLGLETVWKRYGTVLVSDAGGGFRLNADQPGDWIRQSKRVIDVIDNQVRSLRKRLLIDSFVNGHRKGAYWSIRTNIDHYELSDAMDCPFDRTTDLADTSTRLKELPSERQERLINWGYAVCDAAIRKHFDASLPAAEGFPYPDRGV